MKLFFGIVALMLCVLAAVAFVMMQQSAANPGERNCLARWHDSGYQARYTVQTGCQVRTKDGRWLPERAVKESL